MSERDLEIVFFDFFENCMGVRDLKIVFLIFLGFSIFSETESNRKPGNIAPNRNKTEPKQVWPGF